MKNDQMYELMPYCKITKEDFCLTSTAMRQKVSEKVEVVWGHSPAM